LKGGVVGTVMSNLGLERAFQDQSIAFTRVPVGDRYVFEELKRRDWQLGGETSGHILCLEANTTGDGIVAALQVLAAMCQTGQALHELKAGVHKLPQKLLNVHTSCKLDHPTIQQAVQNAEKQLADRGRVLLRPSGTEPVIRVMVEGEDATQVETLANELAKVVQAAGQ